MVRHKRSKLVGFLLLPLLLLLGAGPAVAKCSDPPRPKVDWSKCDREKKRLRDMDLRGGIFERTDLTYTDLSGSNLSGARLLRATVNSARFKAADLTGADLTKAQGSRADFAGAKMVGAVLVKAELARADLTGANLSGADLSKAEFERAVFRNAILERARLAFADLARADLTGARLAGANLEGAYTLLIRVEGTDLSGVTGLSQQQLEIACGDAETRLPEGLTAPAVWPCTPADRE